MIFERLKRYNEKTPERVNFEEECEKEYQLLVELKKKKRQEKARTVVPKNLNNTSKNKKRTNKSSLVFPFRKYNINQIKRDEFSKLILSENTLDNVWDYLLENSSIPIVEGSEMINYEGFMQAKRKLIEDINEEEEALKQQQNHQFQGEDVLPSSGKKLSKEDKLNRLKHYFDPKIFMCFPRDKFGRIPINMFFDFVLKKGFFFQTTLDLSEFDGNNNGYLTVEEFSNFITKFSKQLFFSKQITKVFFPRYLTTCVRKFLFFLPNNKNFDTNELEIKIYDIVESDEISELNDLLNDDLPEHEEMDNWFSLRHVEKVAREFRKLNYSRSGYLSKNEFKCFRDRTLTDVFVDRIFEVYVSNSKEGMSYEEFVDFILAYTHRNFEKSIKYFFKILDYSGTGYLNRLDITFFWKDISKKIRMMTSETIPFQAILSEFYDMILLPNQKRKKRIYLKDLLYLNNDYSLLLKGGRNSSSSNNKEERLKIIGKGLSLLFDFNTYKE